MRPIADHQLHLRQVAQRILGLRVGTVQKQVDPRRAQFQMVQNEGQYQGCGFIDGGNHGPAGRQGEPPLQGGLDACDMQKPLVARVARPVRPVQGRCGGSLLRCVITKKFAVITNVAFSNPFASWRFELNRIRAITA